MKNNFELVCQVAQNLINGTDTKTICDTSDWRVLDGGCESICLINDANGYREDQTIFNVEYKTTNHSGLGFTYFEERINQEEITSDVTFSKEVEKDYEAGDIVEYELLHTIPKESLGNYGFTFYCLVIGECGCCEEENSTHLCGTDVKAIRLDCLFCD